jgi:Ca-activated chloride channel family protein
MVTDILSSEPSGVFGRHAVLVLRRTLIVLSATLITSLVALGVLALLTARGACAAPLQGAGLDEGVAAGLYFNAGREDALFEAPTVASDVAIDLNGQVARVTVRQHFVNPSAVWLEGIYVFPLPEGSAVDRLTMTIGERRIEGRILEKQEAERVYRQAAAEGRKASLLSSKRPNVFVASVANVGPGEAVVIEIGYQDKARYDAGTFSYRFPMVVAPRYTPGAAVPLVRAPFTPEKPNLPSQPIAQPQPASHRGDETGSLPRGRDLFGPVRRPEEGPANPVTLRVRLDAGLPIAALDSLYHQVEVETLGERRRIVTLAGGAVPADRDFVLEWRAASSASPEAALFGEEVDGEAYLMVSLLPPQDAAHGDLAPEDILPPRDLIFVIDTSGSMHGLSIEQARDALAFALSRLQPQDRFNVIRFDNTTEALFGAARPATPDALRRAEAYVLSLQAEGGTEMRPALARALDEPPLPGRLRQVVFLTDGAVSNEQELFTLIAERLGEDRLFTIGIGSAPNSYFMRKAAELGRGSFTYIGDLREVSERMTALFNKLERPALTDVALRFPESVGDGVELYPVRVPDLYAGEPVVFALRLGGLALDGLKGELVITGRRGARLWERRLPLGHGTVAPGVASLWARAKFAEITDGLTRGEDPVRIRKAALDVALPHRLVTRFTSLVAVDDQVSRPRDADLESAEVARNLPKGMDYEHVFGKLGETMQLRSLPAPLMQKAAAGSRAIALPQTATPASWLALSGLVFLLLAAALLIATGRLRRAGVVRRAEA